MSHISVKLDTNMQVELAHGRFLTLDQADGCCSGRHVFNSLLNIIIVANFPMFLENDITFGVPQDL